MTTLLTFLERMAELEETVSITYPMDASIKKGYPVLPTASEMQVLPTPCTMHQYRRIKGSRAVGVRLDSWTVRIQLLVAPLAADADLWSRAAIAFDDALVAAYDADVRLSSTDGWQRIIDEQPEFQPDRFEWNGKLYIGVEYLYEVNANVVKNFG